MSRHADVGRVLESGLVAIIRSPSSEQLVKVAEALYEGGVKVLEITFTVPNALEIIAAVRKALGNKVLVGAGTVLDPETARAAILAGAEFIVAPVVNKEVIQLCHRYDKLVMPGAFTPTEILSAWDAGADVIKLFPGRGGGGIAQGDQGAVSQVRILPTGGVNLDTITDFLKAGACAVGLGSALVEPKAIEAETSSGSNPWRHSMWRRLPISAAPGSDSRPDRCGATASLRIAVASRPEGGLQQLVRKPSGALAAPENRRVPEPPQPGFRIAPKGLRAPHPARRLRAFGASPRGRAPGRRATARVGSRCQPRLPTLRVKNHRHAIVNRREQRVRRGGQDRARLQRGSLRADPAVPDPGHPDRRLVGAIDDVGLFGPLTGKGHPFVEAVRRNQAAATSKRLAKRRFLRDRFGPRIDERGRTRRVGGPTRHEAPLRQTPDQVVGGLGASNDQDRLSRTHVSPRGEVKG